MVLSLCSLAFIFYHKCSKWGKPASHSRQCQKPFSHFWHIFISRIPCPSSETLTQESPVSVALTPNSTRYRKEDLMVTSAVPRAWAFWFPPSHRMWNLWNFSLERAVKCSIQTSGEWHNVKNVVRKGLRTFFILLTNTVYNFATFFAIYMCIQFCFPLFLSLSYLRFHSIWQTSGAPRFGISSAN